MPRSERRTCCNVSNYPGWGRCDDRRYPVGTSWGRRTATPTSRERPRPETGRRSRASTTATPTGCTTSAPGCLAIVTAPRTVCRTRSASRRRACRSCGTRTSCGPGCTAIARNEALRRLRDRRRETPSDELPDKASGEPGPDTLAARTEARRPDRRRGRRAVRPRPLGAGVGVPPRPGRTRPRRGSRSQRWPLPTRSCTGCARPSNGRWARCWCPDGRRRLAGGCPELAAILEGWDGHFNVLMRKRISRHIESCGVCDEQRRRLVTPAALLGAAPVFVPAPACGLRERTLGEVALTSASKPIDQRGPEGSRDARSFLLPGALFVRRIDRRRGIGLHLAQPEGHRHHAHGRQRDDAGPQPVPPARSPSHPPPSPPTVEKTVAPPPILRTPVVESPPPSITPPPISEPTVEAPSEGTAASRTAARVRGATAACVGRNGCRRCCLRRPRREAAPHRR